MPKRGGIYIYIYIYICVGRFSGGINFGGIGINFGGSRPLPRPRARSPGPSGFKRSTSKNTAAPSRPMKAPTKKSLPPKQAPAGWGIGGLGSRIMHGMALFFVAGSEMAHRAIGGMMGGKEESKEIKGEDGGAVMQGDGAQGAAYDNQAYSNPCMEFTNKLAQVYIYIYINIYIYIY